MKDSTKTSIVMYALAVVFLVLAGAFLSRGWGQTPALQPIPLVDSEFLKTATVRTSYAELVSSKADLSDFDCYGCHEKGKPPILRFDEKHNLIVPEEHKDLSLIHI